MAEQPTAKGLLLLALLALAGCARNVERLKQCAPDVARDNGFELAGYAGYNLRPIFGGDVWYRLKPIHDNGIVYYGSFIIWNGECQLNTIRAIDAIAP